MTYSVVALDLDGTLLSPDHTLPFYIKETSKLLAEKNIHFIFATGRHYIDVDQIRNGLGIDAYMITSNGARVHNTNVELILTHNLDPDIVHELCLMEFNHPNILTNYYSSDNWLINRESPEQKAYFQESVFHYQLFERDNFSTTDVSKVYFTCEDHQQLLLLQEQIRNRWSDRVNVSFSLPCCLEVMNGSVSKGNALKQVADLLGYTLQDCIAFGDGMNDYEMLTMAGKGCIMKNSHQLLRDNLPDMENIGSNEEEAVSYYLRQLYSGI
ncbi:sugar/pyridoxal phosphate phosphatase YigL [Arsenophonus endosymbiont of Bemisia tabaci Asia II 3]|nr:sugar/pyridoxal phosphate phosphatase YigL [Arsenophonus endosymbiont of Bemisia tabaci Asia II 3]